MWLDKYYLHVEKGGRRIVSNERNWCQIEERFVLVLQKSDSFTSAELGNLKMHSQKHSCILHPSTSEKKINVII